MCGLSISNMDRMMWDFDKKFTFLPQTNEEVNVYACIRLSVCLSVSKITQKRVHGFG